MADDVFCKIIAGEIKSDTVYEDDDFIVINDINPNAPVHMLIIPKKHIDGVSGLSEEKALFLGKAFLVAEKAAEKAGVKEKGFRLIVNEGSDAGKVVPHFHMHLLAGKHLGAKLIKE